MRPTGVVGSIWLLSVWRWLVQGEPWLKQSLEGGAKVVCRKNFQQSCSLR